MVDFPASHVSFWGVYDTCSLFIRRSCLEMFDGCKNRPVFPQELRFLGKKPWQNQPNFWGEHKKHI